MSNPAQGAVGAANTDAIAWLVKRLKAARRDSEAHPEGHPNRTFYGAQAIAYENVLSLLEKENRIASALAARRADSDERPAGEAFERAAQIADSWRCETYPNAPANIRERTERQDKVARAIAFAIRAEIPDQDDEERCIACDKPLRAGERVLSDASGGTIHATCCGPERESYTGADGEPLGPNDPIPQGHVYEAGPTDGQAVRTILARLWCQAEGNDPDDTISDAGHTVLDGTLGGLDKKAFVAIIEAERAILKATTPPGAPRYQYREIGEGEGWRDCSRESYLAFASDPHIDTREAAATPAQPAGAVPDSLRALSEAASALLSACMADMGPLDESDSDDEPVGMSGFGVGTAVTFGHLRRLERALASHPAGQSAGSGERIAEIVNRWHDWIVSASADMDQPEWSSGSRQTMEDDRDFLLRALPAPKPAPDSTRTGQGEAEAIARAAYVRICRHEGKEGWRDAGEAFDTRNDDGGSYLPIDSAALELAMAIAAEALAARPAAPEAQGTWRFDMEAAPRDGSDVEVVNDRGRFIAQFDRSWGRSYADAGWWMVSDGKDTERPLRGDEPFAWRIPTKAPAPPASSGQEG